jgi:hypothetical protein
MDSDNITFVIDENEDENESNKNTKIDFNFDLELETKSFQDETVSKIINYNLNYLTKDLLVICDYYGIGKNLKASKANKDQIIETLVFFENRPENQDIVLKRNTMWFYMNELKNDKFMRKFILLWN